LTTSRLACTGASAFKSIATCRCAEIIIQPEAGRWLFTPAELGELLDGLNAILLTSNPDAGWPFRLTRTQYIGLFTPIYHGV
jgi:hypothetical protein